MSAPGSRRRRRRASPASRLRPFWFLVAMLGTAAALGGYVLLTWSALDPHTVEVSGNRIVSKDAIVDRAHIDLTRNMWLQNTHAMARRIEAIPYIDRAVVRRRPPDTLTIAVTERVPYALVDAGLQRAIVDDTLRVLSNADARPANAALPVLHLPKLAIPAAGATIADANATQLVTIAERAGAAGLAVKGLSYDRFGDVVLELRSGVRVLLGDATNLGRRLAMVDPILAQVGRGRRRITAIDLRAIATPVVVYAR